MYERDQVASAVQNLVERAIDACKSGNSTLALPYAGRAASMAEQIMHKQGTIKAQETYANTLYTLGVALLKANNTEGASGFLEECLQIRERIDAGLGTTETKDAVADTCYQLGMTGDQPNLFRSLRMREELADELRTEEARRELADTYLGISELGGTMLYASDAEMYLYRYLDILAQIALESHTKNASQAYRYSTYAAVRKKVKETDDKVYANRLIYKYLDLRKEVVLNIADQAQWGQLITDAISFLSKDVLTVSANENSTLVGWFLATVNGVACGSIPIWTADDLGNALHTMSKTASLAAAQDAALRLSESRVKLAYCVSRKNQDAESAESLKHILFDYRDMCILYENDSFSYLLQHLYQKHLEDSGDVITAIALADAHAKEYTYINAWPYLQLCDYVFTMQKDKNTTQHLQQALRRFARYLNTVAKRQGEKAQLQSTDGIEDQITLFLNASSRYACSYAPKDAARVFADETIDTIRLIVRSFTDRAYAGTVLLPQYLDLRTDLAFASNDETAWTKFTSDVSLLLSDASHANQVIVTATEPMLQWSRKLFSRLQSNGVPQIALQVCAVLFATFSSYGNMRNSNARDSAAAEYYTMQVKLRERVADMSNTETATRAFKNAILSASNSSVGRSCAYETCLNLGKGYVRGAGSLATVGALADSCESLMKQMWPKSAAIDLAWMNLALCTRIDAQERSDQSQARVRKAVTLCGNTLEELAKCHNRKADFKYVNDVELRIIQYLDLEHQLLREQRSPSMAISFSDETFNRLQGTMATLDDKLLANRIAYDYLTKVAALVRKSPSNEAAWERLAQEAVTLAGVLPLNDAQKQGIMTWCKEMCQSLVDNEAPLFGIRAIALAFAHIAALARASNESTACTLLVKMEASLIDKGASTFADANNRNEFSVSMLAESMAYLADEDTSRILNELDKSDTVDSQALVESLTLAPLKAGAFLARQINLFEQGNTETKERAKTLLQKGLALVEEVSSQHSGNAKEVRTQRARVKAEYELGRVLWSLSMNDLNYIGQAKTRWIDCANHGSALVFAAKRDIRAANWYVAILSNIQHDLCDFVAVDTYRLHADAVKVTRHIIKCYEEVAKEFKNASIQTEYVDALSCAKTILEARGSHYFRKETARIDAKLRTATNALKSL